MTEVNIYVDGMKARYGRMTMCHMIANDLEALHLMADVIGVNRKWFQGDHYDISLSKRALAVAAGAKEITWRQAGFMMRQVRQGLPMPLPEKFEEWMAQRVEARKLLGSGEGT